MYKVSKACETGSNLTGKHALCAEFPLREASIAVGMSQTGGKQVQVVWFHYSGNGNKLD